MSRITSLPLKSDNLTLLFLLLRTFSNSISGTLSPIDKGRITFSGLWEETDNDDDELEAKVDDDVEALVEELDTVPSGDEAAMSCANAGLTIEPSNNTNQPNAVRLDIQRIAPIIAL
jgi:hypothetical protein